MVDINDDTKPARRHVEVTGVVRRRRWTDEEKGRIVAEAVSRGAVIAEVARRHELAPQHLSNWIRAAKNGRFTLPAEGMPAFVPVVVEPARPKRVPTRESFVTIEIMIGSVRVKVPGGADARTVDAVLRALRRGSV